MSQAPVRPAVPGPVTAPPAPAGGAPVPTGNPGLELPPPIPSRTPQLLQRLQVVVALAVLITAAMSVWVISDLRADLASAPNLAQQYARLGEVQHDLSTAARLADMSVILGEAADGTNAKAAIDQVVAASGLLVEAAKDRPQDAEALQAIGGTSLRYSLALSAAVGTPRAQALPRLTTAHKQLDDLLGQIDQLQAQLADEAQTRPWSQGTPAVWLVGLAMTGVLVWVSWLVAQVEHAMAALLVVLGITAAAQGAASDASDTSRSSQFTHVVNATTAVRHLDAAQQVLTTAVLTQTWDASAQAAYTRESKAAGTATGHEDMVGPGKVDAARDVLAALMTKGDWKGATTKLLADGNGSLSAAADSFRESAGTVSDAAVSVAAAAPTNTRATLVVQLVFVIALALAGAALGVLGLFQRIREYR